jgi:hypothetical protein
MPKSTSNYTGQHVFLANQAGLNKPKSRPTGPDNKPSLDQAAALYEAGYEKVLADWVSSNYPPEHHLEIQEVLEIAIQDETCTLDDAMTYITTHITRG